MDDAGNTINHETLERLMEVPARQGIVAAGSLPVEALRAGRAPPDPEAGGGDEDETRVSHDETVTRRPRRVQSIRSKSCGFPAGCRLAAAPVTSPRRSRSTDR